jgi:N-acyl-D-amino-acid deacylase
LIEEARKRGVEVTADVYPYVAGSSSVTITMPPWTLVGGLDGLVGRLKDPETRRKIRSDIENTSDWENLIMKLGYENIVVTFCRKPSNKKYEGKNIAEIARMMGKEGEDQLDAWFDFLVDDEAGGHEIEFYGSEHDLQAIMAHPLVMFCSDMWTFGASAAEGRPHPRAYGAFPRVLGRYVRESRLLGLEEAVRKMTSAPAQKIGAFDRGLVKPGMWADLVVFDQDTVLDRATYADPHLHPSGIECVIVNGVVTVAKDTYLGKRAGMVVRRQRVARKPLDPES